MSEQTPETATDASVSAAVSQEAEETAPASASPSVEEIAQEPVDWERRAMILSFWAVVLLGLPWWWRTTRLVRLPLPSAEIQRWKALQPDPLALPLSFSRTGDFSGKLVNARESRTEDDDEWMSGLTLLDVDEATGSTVEWSEETDELALSGTPGDDYEVVVRSAQDRLARLQMNDARVIKYSQRVKLVFSLLHQDNAAEHSGGSPGWAFRPAFDGTLLVSPVLTCTEHILPLLTPLADLHDFTVETQIQHFAPLSFEPERLEVGSFVETIKLDPYGDGKSWIEQPEGLAHLGTVIEEDQLKAFVNSADWPLGA